MNKLFVRLFILLTIVGFVEVSCVSEDKWIKALGYGPAEIHKIRIDRLGHW